MGRRIGGITGSPTLICSSIPVSHQLYRNILVLLCRQSHECHTKNVRETLTKLTSLFISILTGYYQIFKMNRILL